ncbi:MAG: serine/threonine-protein kinase [Holophagaceae bacterium]
MHDETRSDGPGPTAPGAGFQPSQAPTRKEGAPERDVAELEASLRDWDRYEVLGFLAQGGMGRVYKARDRKLGRLVALKFILSDSASAAQRFAREAQAQARVHHEAVCPIHEVGEWRGQPYIVLQYIDGKPLNACLKGMGLEEKVDLVRRAAEGLHAAHRLGLIHRDVKTGNIMVERREDGRLQPYVMDFGLARALEAPGVTQTGLIVGTPAYMAPEQARGEAGAVDRRSDVYALGATLYEVLTGRLPFDARTSVDVLVAILTEEPRPLRALVPSLPQDLEAITLKCLEKEPARRYDSAQALAEDLQRFLDGEPVKARQIGALRRLERRVRRHPAASAVVAASVAVALVLGGWGLRSALRARHQAALAQAFAQDAAQLDTRLRVGRLLPLHDLRAEKAAVRERMADIEGRMARLGRLAQGPGRAALGRGHLALGELAAARRELEEAWGLGHRTPDTANALGQVLAGLYEAALQEARRVRDPAARAARKRELERTLRDPALRYLEAGRDLPGLKAYTEGLIALQEERFDEALAKAAEAASQVPWLTEARALEGRAWSLRAGADAERGAYAEAREAARRSEAAYASAFEVARSDEAMPLGRAAAFLQEMAMDVEQGRPTDRAFERALEALTQARRVDPLRPEAFALEARLQWLRASDLDNSGRDGRGALKASLAAAEEALRLEPRDLEHHERVANAAWYLSQQETNRGADGGPALAKAEAAARQGLALDEGRWGLHRSLGVVHGIRAEARFREGADPVPELEASVAAFRRARELNPDAVQVLGNLANALVLLAEAKADRGEDPREALLQAEASLQRALELNPQFADSWDERGKVRFRLALHALQTGGDPRADLALALGHFEAALARNPAMPQATVHRAQALLLRAAYLRDAGGDPAPDLAAAEASARAARAIIRDYSEIVATFVDVLLLKAEAEAAARRPFAPVLEACREALVLALKRDGGSPYLWDRRARVELLAARLAPASAASRLPLAEAALARAEGLTARTPALLNLRARLCLDRALRASAPEAPGLLARGLEATEASRRLNARQPEALALRAALLMARSRRGGQPRDAAEARAALVQALKENPLLRREWEPLVAGLGAGGGIPQNGGPAGPAGRTPRGRP